MINAILDSRGPAPDVGAGSSVSVPVPPVSSSCRAAGAHVLRDKTTRAEAKQMAGTEVKVTERLTARRQLSVSLTPNPPS